MSAQLSSVISNMDRERIKKSLERAIRIQFPRDTVDISDGYEDNIHILVTSRQFDNMSESHRHEIVGELIENANLTKREEGLISLVILWSVDELLSMHGGRYE